MTVHFDLPEWLLGALGLLAVLIGGYVVVGCYMLGHMDERYRDQIKWAWQDWRRKRAAKNQKNAQRPQQVKGMAFGSGDVPNTPPPRKPR